MNWSSLGQLITRGLDTTNSLGWYRANWRCACYDHLTQEQLDEIEELCWNSADDDCDGHIDEADCVEVDYYPPHQNMVVDVKETLIK